MSRHHRVNTWISARTRAEQAAITKWTRDLDEAEEAQPALALGQIAIKVRPHPDDYFNLSRPRLEGSEMDMIE